MVNDLTITFKELHQIVFSLIFGFHIPIIIFFKYSIHWNV